MDLELLLSGYQLVDLGHGYGTNLLIQAHLGVCCAVWQSGQSVRQGHLLTWAIPHGEVVPLHLQDHPLQAWWCCMEWLLKDHNQGFVVSYHSEGSSIKLMVEPQDAVDHSQTFSLNVAVVRLGRCQRFASKNYWSFLLPQCCS